MDKQHVIRPKIIHQIWIGDNPLPKYYKYFKASWKKYMPQYKYKLWKNRQITRKNFPITFDTIQMLFKMQQQGYKKYAQISDLMRYEILYNHGGYYFDITFEPVKNMDAIFNKASKKTFVGCNEVTGQVNYLSNSFIGCTKNHDIVKNALANINKINYKSNQISAQSGPFFLYKYYSLYKKQAHIFPTRYFYPFITWETLDRKQGTDKCMLKKPSLDKSKINIRLNHDKYLIYPCTEYKSSFAIKHWDLGKSWWN